MAAGVFTVDSGATVTLTTKADGTTSFYNLTISVNIANGAVNFVNSFNVNNDLFFLSTTTSGYSSWVRCPANDCLVTVAGNVLVTNSGSSTNWQTLVGDPSSSQNFTVKMTGGTQANPKTLTVSETGQYGPMVYFYSKLQIAGYVTVSQSYNSSIPAFGLNNANSTMTINNGGTLKVGSAVTSNYYSITNNGTLETGSNNFTNNGALTNNGTVVTGTGTFTNNGAFTNNDTFSLGSGISDINGAFINSVTGIVVPTAGTWNQSGDFTDNGTFTATGGLFVFDTYAYGAKTLTFSPNNTTTFYNLKFNTDVQGWYGYLTIYLVNNFTVSNDLLFNQTSNNPYGYTTSLISTNNTVITVHKNVTVTNNGSSTYTTVGDPAGTSNFTIKMVDGTQASPTVFTYTQTGTTTVRLYAKLEFAGYTNISCSVDNPSYSTFGANVAGSTLTTDNGGTVVMGNVVSSYYSIINNGTFDSGSGIFDNNSLFINNALGVVRQTAGTWNQSGDFTDNGTFTATGGLFVFDTYAYGAKTLTFSPNNTTTFYNLKFNTDVQGWYGYLTIYLVNNFTVSNDLLFNQTSNNPYGYTTSLISTNNTVITVHKNVTVTNNGSSTYTTVGDPAGTSNFTIKMVDGTQASPTVFTYTQTGTTTVRLYAKLEFAGYTNISCSVDNPSYSTFGANVAGSTMAISNGATAVMLTALPSSYYSFTNNGTLYTNGYTPTIPYIFANNGTLKVQGGETLAITNKDIDSGTVEYVGDGGSTSYTNLIYGNTYYSLKINSTSGNNAFTNNANLAIANDLTISNGTFNANALTINILNLVTTGGALNAGSSNIVVSGNWDSSGSIWSCNTSTVVFSAVSGTPAIKTGGQPFYNMNIQKPTGDLVAYWSMNETTGTASVADSSINNNTATSARTTNVTTGIFGNGRSFDGTNDIITVPSQTYYDPGSNDFTIDLWVNFTANNVGYQLILDRRSTVDQTGYILYLESNNTLNFLASSVSSWNILVQSSYVPPTGQWLHISMVRSGNSWNLYVDGVSKASATNSNSVGAVTTNPTIGGGHVAGTMNKVQGTIDEVRYYSRALTLVQIESLRNGIDPFGVSTATYSCQSNLSILNNLNALTATLDVSTNN